MLSKLAVELLVCYSNLKCLRRAAATLTRLRSGFIGSRACRDWCVLFAMMRELLDGLYE